MPSLIHEVEVGQVTHARAFVHEPSAEQQASERRRTHRRIGAVREKAEHEYCREQLRDRLAGVWKRSSEAATMRGCAGGGKIQPQSGRRCMTIALRALGHLEIRTSALLMSLHQRSLSGLSGAETRAEARDQTHGRITESASSPAASATGRGAGVGSACEAEALPCERDRSSSTAPSS